MGRNRLYFILIKNFLSNMMQKKTKHFLCFIFETSKTLKVKILKTTKNFEKIAENNNEIVKKQQKTTVQLHQRSCEKIQRMQHRGAFVFARDPNLYVRSLRRKNFEFLV